MKNSGEESLRRYIIRIHGIVQGVGYRPYIYRQAVVHHITGWVNNQGTTVVIDGEGTKENLQAFLRDILHKPPSLAVIEKIRMNAVQRKGYPAFSIRESDGGEGELPFISADVGICPHCLEEISDPDGRWYKYPFTNCTACGPRYTIIKDLPYDREHTVMSAFAMCPDCQREYDDPFNRRFHAQPTCCPVCGPALTLLNQWGEKVVCDDPVSRVRELFKAGKIIAVKGLGGFHLACNGEDAETIRLLRKRKNRPHKPLAVMSRDLACIREQCVIHEGEALLLQSSQKPIVLLNKSRDFSLPTGIAPENRKVGVMLPYTPLHHLIFDDDIKYLVMTSGNRSSAPIQYQNHEAVKELSGIVDFFLLHNRDIHIPMDDSVTKIVHDTAVIVRRARGYTPWTLKMGLNHEILALGAELKSTFAMGTGGYGIMSQYLGDLTDGDAARVYQKNMDHLLGLLKVEPEIIAYDMHPVFFSSHLSHSLKGIRVPVQHHHAHMVSCMVEHGLHGPAIGVVYDGTGMGDDGRIWGGEFFVASRKAYTRVGHLKYISIQGGDLAVKQPWRTALSYLETLGYDPSRYLDAIRPDVLDMVRKAHGQRVNCYETSSMGRLFDAVSALLGLCHEASYDAQGAIALENVSDYSIQEGYPYAIEKKDDKLIIDYGGMIKEILEDVEAHIPASMVSGKFHYTVVQATMDVVLRIRMQYDCDQVVLSGGCFENEYLLKSVYAGLLKYGFRVFYNQQVPTNDSGISMGQLAIADQQVEG